MLPFPNVFSPTSFARPLTFSAPATISDADAEPLLINTTIGIFVSLPFLLALNVCFDPPAFSCMAILPSFTNSLAIITDDLRYPPGLLRRSKTRPLRRLFLYSDDETISFTALFHSSVVSSPKRPNFTYTIRLHSGHNCANVSHVNGDSLKFAEFAPVEVFVQLTFFISHSTEATLISPRSTFTSAVAVASLESIVKSTVDPLGPRIFDTVSGSVQSAVSLPSTFTIQSPGFKPTFSPDQVRFYQCSNAPAVPRHPRKLKNLHWRFYRISR